MFKDHCELKYTECMASSHSITLYKDEPIGDMLEIEMFKTAQWVMMETTNPKYAHDSTWGNLLIPKEVEAISHMSQDDEMSHLKLQQVHKFDFSSDLQRMSVIAKPNYDDQFVLYTKGAPEQIYSLCNFSELPDDFYQILNENTSKGRRVIALAYKYLPNFDIEQIDYLNRKDVEKDLKFLGFLVMSNNVKDNTQEAIIELKEGLYLIL